MHLKLQLNILPQVLTLLLAALLIGSPQACIQLDPVPEPGEKKVDPTPTPTPTPDPEPESDYNVTGYVRCGNEGMKGVAVSDGINIVLTDSLGQYKLKSEKLHGYVFISIPSGYEVEQDGVIPRFFQYLDSDKSKKETHDFELKAVDQTKYRVLFFGDIHLANRTTFKDQQQFRTFTSDVKTLMDDSFRVYAITLGDMSWDYFWISHNYDLRSYLSEVNYDFGTSLPIFHTMGNHDNDPSKTGDFYGEAAYKSIIGPTYYSFNIGEAHYIVMDDMDYKNDNGNRNFWYSFVYEQFEWFKKDLALVPRDTPIFVTFHTPLYKTNGSIAIYTNGSDFVSLLKDRPATVVSGHMHTVSNVQGKVFESNSGAVCAGWWVTWCNEGIHICTDGAPGGYRVMDVDGKNWDWYYRGTGLDPDFQFRSYDRNCIQLSAANWTPNATQNGKQKFEEAAGEYKNASSDNYVLLNVWDYDPSWTISVKENGQPLNVTQRSDLKDPLYLVCYEAYEYEHHYDNSVSYPCSTTNHIFQVQASSPSSTLEIEVTDRDGRVHKETMTRPKPFTIASYKP